MDRRAFIGAIARGLLAAPLAAEGHRAIYRIGYLSPDEPLDSLCACSGPFAGTPRVPLC
jgi:hypothetical protein